MNGDRKAGYPVTRQRRPALLQLAKWLRQQGFHRVNWLFSIFNIYSPQKEFEGRRQIHNLRNSVPSYWFVISTKRFPLSPSILFLFCLIFSGETNHAVKDKRLIFEFLFQQNTPRTFNAYMDSLLNSFLIRNGIEFTTSQVGKVFRIFSVYLICCRCMRLSVWPNRSVNSFMERKLTPIEAENIKYITVA